MLEYRRKSARDRERVQKLGTVGEMRGKYGEVLKAGGRVSWGSEHSMCQRPWSGAADVRRGSGGGRKLGKSVTSRKSEG